MATRRRTAAALAAAQPQPQPTGRAAKRVKPAQNVSPGLPVPALIDASHADAFASAISEQISEETATTIAPVLERLDDLMDKFGAFSERLKAVEASRPDGFMVMPDQPVPELNSLISNTAFRSAASYSDDSVKLVQRIATITDGASRHLELLFNKPNPANMAEARKTVQVLNRLSQVLAASTEAARRCSDNIPPALVAGQAFAELETQILNPDSKVAAGQKRILEILDATKLNQLYALARSSMSGQAGSSNVTVPAHNAFSMGQSMLPEQSMATWTGYQPMPTQPAPFYGHQGQHPHRWINPNPHGNQGQGAGRNRNNKTNGQG
jgi:hypothetical protein